MLEAEDQRKADEVCSDQLRLNLTLDEVCLTLDQIEVLWLMYGEASNENKDYFIQAFESEICDHIDTYF